MQTQILSEPRLVSRSYTIAFLFLCGFSFFLDIAISFTQGFLFLSIIGLFYFLHRMRKNGIAVSWFSDNDEMKHLSWLILIWVNLRILHILTSSNKLNELIQFREIWLMAVPFLVFILAKRAKRVNVLILLFMAGALFPVGVSMRDALRDGFFNEGTRAFGMGSTHHLTFSGTTGIVLLLGMGGFLSVWKNNKKLSMLMLVMLALVFTGFFLAKSRGGYVALLVTISFFAIFLLRRKSLILLPVILILGTFMVSRTTNQGFMSRLFAQAVPKPGSHSGTLEQRFDMWNAGIRMFIAKPVIGTGDADFSQQYMKYKEPEAVAVAAMASHLHNDYLNTAVLYGAGGLTVHLAFYLLPLSFYFRERRKLVSRENFWLMTGAAAAIVLMMIMGLSQCHFTDEEVQMAFWLAVGILYRSGQNDRELRAGTSGLLT